jgi:hypothetical protein
MDASIPIADRYRARALDCLHDAREVGGDEDFKTVFHRLAVLWIVLAHQTEGRAPKVTLEFSAPQIDLPLY